MLIGPLCALGIIEVLCALARGSHCEMLNMVSPTIVCCSVCNLLSYPLQAHNGKFVSGTVPTVERDNREINFVGAAPRQ
jgi:hypothetical protein